MEERIIDLARQVITSEDDDKESRVKVARQFYRICSIFSSRLVGLGNYYLIARALFDVYTLEIEDIPYDELKVMILFCLFKYIRKDEMGEIDNSVSSITSAYALAFLFCSENPSFIESLMINDGYVNAGQRVGILIIYFYYFYSSSSVNVSFTPSINEKLRYYLFEVKKDFGTLSVSDRIKLKEAGQSIMDRMVRYTRHQLFDLFDNQDRYDFI